MSYSLKIGHLLPDLLDMYGDKGNIASLKWRMQQRGMQCETISFTSGIPIDLGDIDIILLGGGSDKAEMQALSILSEYKNDLKNYIEGGGAMLAVCGGFPLLGKYISADGTKTDCLDVLDIYTEIETPRLTGNVTLETESFGTVVGFENHAGRTYTGEYTPLGKVLKGFGNCGAGYEGVIYKNLFATYLHGPLLPKNPSLADAILSRALKQKYGEEITLSPLDDLLENEAHAYAENL